MQQPVSRRDDDGDDGRRAAVDARPTDDGELAARCRPERSPHRGTASPRHCAARPTTPQCLTRRRHDQIGVEHRCAPDVVRPSGYPRRAETLEQPHRDKCDMICPGSVHRRSTRRNDGPRVLHNPCRSAQRGRSRNPRALATWRLTASEGSSSGAEFRQSDHAGGANLRQSYRGPKPAPGA